MSNCFNFRSTNGGFYPGIPVAAYQKTYVNQLRSYDKVPNYRVRTKYGQRSTSFKNYRIMVESTSQRPESKGGAQGRSSRNAKPLSVAE